MADENKAPDGPEPSQPIGATRIVTVRLTDLPNPADYIDEFAFRFKDKYKQPENLDDLVESIKLYKGLYEAPQIVKRPDGKWVIVCGHRRIATLYILAKRGEPGFSLGMEVVCMEVVGSSRVALMARSMSTNEIGMRLEPMERLMAVKTMDAAGATKKEIAVAAKVVEKSIERDLKVVRNPRVLQHVVDNNLTYTDAVKIVEVAKARLGEFLDYFDAWALAKIDEIDAEDRRLKQERGRGLKPAQMLVVNHLEPHIVRGWLDQLVKGQPFSEAADLGFEASFDKKNAVAIIKVKVDARNDTVEHVTRIASQVSQVAKHLMAFAQKRHELEGPMGPQAALQKDEGFLDRELLAQFGLEALVDLDDDDGAEETAQAESPPAETQQDAKDGNK